MFLPNSFTNRIRKYSASASMSPGRCRKGESFKQITLMRSYEILAEPALLDQCWQIVAARHQEADVGSRSVTDVAVAVGLELAVMQRLEQLSLEVFREAGHLVDEHGAAKGLVELGGPVSLGLGPAVGHIALPLVLGQHLGQGRIVEDDQRLVAAGRRGRGSSGQGAPCPSLVRRQSRPGFASVRSCPQARSPAADFASQPTIPSSRANRSAWIGEPIAGAGAAFDEVPPVGYDGAGADKAVNDVLHPLLGAGECPTPFDGRDVAGPVWGQGLHYHGAARSRQREPQNGIAPCRSASLERSGCGL